ncbi:MAG: DUF1614 domain-containing protein [Planctomycetales bacterium]|nr:DUF1614 domain-containing protein [Planctomycetales bacterium]
MQDPRFQFGSGSQLPTLGCVVILASLCLVCMMPVLLVSTMQTAIERLHLSAPAATLAVVGIFLGGLVNIPVYQLDRSEAEHTIDMKAMFGVPGMAPRFEQVRRGTVVAVNLGGCVVPLALVVVQVAHIVATGGWVLVAAAGITAANVIACWRLAQPVPGIGIRMPALVSALVAVGGTWILLGAADLELYRAPVAFTAGVLGPLVGADLMHLGDLSKVSVGMLSIGGAGTFDGIVLSGVLAALVA